MNRTTNTIFPSPPQAGFFMPSLGAVEASDNGKGL